MNTTYKVFKNIENFKRASVSSKKNKKITVSTPFSEYSKDEQKELLKGDAYWVSREVDLPLPAGNHHFLAIEVSKPIKNSFKAGDKNFVGWSGYSVNGDLKFIDANEADRQGLQEYFSKDKGKPWFKKYWGTEVQKISDSGKDFNKRLINHIDTWNSIPSDVATGYSFLTTNCIYLLYNLVNSTGENAKKIFKKFTGVNPMSSKLLNPKLFMEVKKDDVALKAASIAFRKFAEDMNLDVSKKSLKDINKNRGAEEQVLLDSDRISATDLAQFAQEYDKKKELKKLKKTKS